MPLNDRIIEIQKGDRWVRINEDMLEPGQVFRVQPREKKMRYTTHMGRHRLDNYPIVRQLGLEDKPDFMRRFENSLSTVKFDMEVDTETGITWIIAVNGVELTTPVRG